MQEHLSEDGFNKIKDLKSKSRYCVDCANKNNDEICKQCLAKDMRRRPYWKPIIARRRSK